LNLQNNGEDDLPEHLHEVLGDSDPPLSSYARCVEVVEMLESILPKEMYRTLTGLMFSILMDQETKPEDENHSLQRPGQLQQLQQDRSNGKNG
jgi:hypothetical protein